jgi:hypothetical protein
VSQYTYLLSGMPSIFCWALPSASAYWNAVVKTLMYFQESEHSIEAVSGKIFKFLLFMLIKLNGFGINGK